MQVATFFKPTERHTHTQHHHPRISIPVAKPMLSMRARSLSLNKCFLNVRLNIFIAYCSEANMRGEKRNQTTDQCLHNIIRIYAVSSLWDIEYNCNVYLYVYFYKKTGLAKCKSSKVKIKYPCYWW